jgi:hypothetical protein
LFFSPVKYFTLLASFILYKTYNINNLRPPKNKPSAYNVIDGSVTSSIKYNNLKDGKAINININAGVIVQISSIKVPWFKYLLLIGDLLLTKFLTIDSIIQPTPNKIIAK